MTTYEIFIDRQTGTWGMASDLVIATVPEAVVNHLESLSDSQLIQVAYDLEDGKEISSPDLHPESA